LHLFINPTLLGSGKSPFAGVDQSALQLQHSQTFGCGIVVLVYRPVRHA